jgi:hypothetical protein
MVTMVPELVRSTSRNHTALRGRRHERLCWLCDGYAGKPNASGSRQRHGCGPCFVAVQISSVVLHAIAQQSAKRG